MRKVTIGNLRYGFGAALLLAAHTLAAQTPSAQSSNVQTISAQLLAPSRPSLPPGQVWQCIHNGQRVFSDTRCGDGATIRQLNDTNRMDTAPAWRGAAYPAAYPAPFPAPYPDEGVPEETVDPIYVTQSVTVVNRSQHVARAPRPHHHDSRPAQTRTGHAAAH
jgi:hypothetical protein